MKYILKVIFILLLSASSQAQALINDIEYTLDINSVYIDTTMQVDGVYSLVEILNFDADTFVFEGFLIPPNTSKKFYPVYNSGAEGKLFVNPIITNDDKKIIIANCYAASYISK